MTLLQVVKERTATPIRQMISAADVYEVMRFLEKEDREKLYTLHLDTLNRIVAMECVSVGNLTGSLAHPREVFKAAILNNSHAIVLVHNHPSGSIKPSHADILLTKRLREAGDLLGIEVLDHVIIGDNGFGRVPSPKDQAKEQARELAKQHAEEISAAAAKKKARRKKSIKGRKIRAVYVREASSPCR